MVGYNAGFHFWFFFLSQFYFSFFFTFFPKLILSNFFNGDRVFISDPFLTLTHLNTLITSLYYASILISHDNTTKTIFDTATKNQKNAVIQEKRKLLSTKPCCSFKHKFFLYKANSSNTLNTYLTYYVSTV